jgi:hypothetical protein
VAPTTEKEHVMLPALALAAICLAAPERQKLESGHPPEAPQVLIALNVNDREELVIRDYEIVIINRGPKADPTGGHFPRERAVPLDGVRVVTASGKEVDRKGVRERLKKEEAVFAMSWGRVPLHVYKAAMKPDSLLLIFPREAPRPESNRPRL